MKQLLVLSGKGGTGKTTIATALIQLTQARVYADCDVDAPNLHLLMHQSSEPDQKDFYGLDKAVIHPEQCTACNLCRQHCRFEAIHVDPETGCCQVNPFACEGCGVCSFVCPAEAVSMEPAKAGELMLYTGDSVFSTAMLKMGSGNSGMLVTEVKKRMKKAAAPTERLAVIDGSPGIGCPVIASMTGVDMILIVAEPSISGISDMKRVVETAQGLQAKMAVCINQWDNSPAHTDAIEAYCREMNLPVMGRIPYDPEVVKAVNRGKSITEVSCKAGEAVNHIHQQLITILFKQ
jgi:MinD superfamily P-loop ATPase